MLEMVSFKRRRYPRFNIDLSIRYHQVDWSTGGNGRAMKVSEGGRLICSLEQMEMDQNLKSKLFSF
jgi:hypothetical protein